MSRKKEAIKLKVEKAKTLMQEVDILLQNHLFNTAINRLYYSCFHATKALLLTKDLTPKTHAGVSSLLHKEFVNNSLFEANRAGFFDKLMAERIDDDYSDFIIKEIAEIEVYFEPAKEYFNYTITLINKLMEDFD